ncbi:MAG: AIR carboxylase family protein [Actinomycetia bacterium]|nr:AIR carboxylase family protein [Actinomycetes bacterium]MCP4226902.1 AIR carboxylase family protein [Actinomycetes bacterium]MCP5035790.1 AIR carboxylase family protein [Actinomycetes bacterium]
MPVVILSGSPRDQEWVNKIVVVLDRLAIPTVRRVGSAHRVPEHVLDLLRHYDQGPDPIVFITVAGMSDALSGLTDANVISPVIACPPRSDAFAGLDVLSSLRTPPGVAPAVALDPANAALAAAKILALHDPDLRTRISVHQTEAQSRVLEADRALIDQEQAAGVTP